MAVLTDTHWLGGKGTVPAGHLYDTQPQNPSMDILLVSDCYPKTVWAMSWTVHNASRVSILVKVTNEHDMSTATIWGCRQINAPLKYIQRSGSCKPRGSWLCVSNTKKCSRNSCSQLWISGLRIYCCFFRDNVCEYRTCHAASCSRSLWSLSLCAIFARCSVKTKYCALFRGWLGLW